MKSKIDVPTLLMDRRDDTAQDQVLAPNFRHIPQVKWVQFSLSSHTVHIEERERVTQLIGDFMAED